ncbi:Uma2 family endonuclease [Micromonospora chaiyaphumensis]|uniref:Putative restriction endonuclease n=1 Tax=Micromonospora chaiyaphumensis TaxID=307119 RepID=A0A1C4YW86_9ACTN|nr:Uma2 family endonuclease [Micromonospora chaiyaphumensis]SCF25022.1 Putative restriction endonuclease [Micromonospora chaiyaphumensis]
MRASGFSTWSDHGRAAASLELLGIRDQAWTAGDALKLLPETNGPRIEVLRGCVVVTPGGSIDRRGVQMELGHRIRTAARAAGWWAYPSVNVVSGDDLFIPDLVVLRSSGGGRRAVDIATAVLLGEIAPAGLFDRPREYAAAEVPFFLRVDLRNRVPALALYELVEGEYRPLAAAAAGATFVMWQPFEFSVDPADLLDEEAPEEASAEASGAGE